MSAQLKFVVTDQIITRTDTFQPVAKSQNYLVQVLHLTEVGEVEQKLQSFKQDARIMK